MSLSALLVVLLSSPPGRAADPATRPAPSAPRSALDHATELADQQRPRDAATYAMTAFTRTELPRSERLDLALFAQAEYATLYRLFEDSPPGDPEDLCRALEILALADPLVTTDEERRKLEKWRSGHRSALQADYPAHTCTLVAAPEVPTKPSQEQTPRDLAPSAKSPPAPVAPLERRILVLHVGGGSPSGWVSPRSR